MVWIELRFPVIGTALPSDHGYAMYSAISKVIPEAHQADWLAVETVPGTARGDGGIHINERARLRMRMPDDRLSLMLKLAGKRLDVDGYGVRLGVPQTFLLKPSSTLYARCVTIKKFMEPEPFLEAVHRKLDEMGIRGEIAVGPRRVLRVGKYTVVGFALAIGDLSDDASILLQERGLGGRRHMGCGIFNPISPDRVIGEPLKQAQEKSRG
jgi:CRISPR-associated endonuclease/helicase Cas3